jgi:hypothetical protein
MRIRGCPAAVSRNESRHRALGASWEATADRTRGRAIGRVACESGRPAGAPGTPVPRWSAASREGEQAKERDGATLPCLTHGVGPSAHRIRRTGAPPGRWTSKAGSLVGQLRGCSRGDYKKIIHGGVPG